ncbi:MAG TPA: T9SS type A sorting domain-containing protein [Flavobacteriales bacterium]|nr:T9SS type A sorting domain-containing protein [Flavobacteriales bacterium]HNO03932.1 T9SS type A sorting domain-containing protein [Flavobacteriales bacterium]
MLIAIQGQGQDYFGDPVSPPVYFSPQQGQFAHENGSPMNDQKFKSYGNTPEIWAAGSSIVNFVFAVPDTANPGRGRIQMKPTGELARQVTPDTVTVAPGIDNFYYPWCPNGITGVPRYHRIRYKDLIDKVDLDLYSTPSGLRMALICHPGFDPNSLYLAFVGQDSLDVDVNGELRAHLNGKYLSFREAIAYQVDQFGMAQSLNWNGTWQEAGGVGTAKIVFVGDYDPFEPVILQIGPPPLPAQGGPDNQNEGLDWSTSFGDDNNGSIMGDQMGGATTAPNGDLLVAIAHGVGEFPPSPGWTPGYGEAYDACVGRYEYAPGDPLEDAEQSYITHYGGGNDHVRPQAVLLNQAATALYVGGFVRANGLPTFPDNDPMDDSYWEDTRKGASDGFLMRMDPTDGTIQRFSYFGGGGDDAITAFTEDGEGNIWFSGITTSTTGAEADCNSPTSAFPLCDPPGANYWQPANAGDWDAFVARADPDFKLTLSTFYGGPGIDIVYDMAYMANPIPSNRRIALVGRSLGTVPQNNTGSFHLDGIDGEKSGFIATFDFGGDLKWSTNVQKLNSLQSVAVRGNQLVVLGYCHSSDAYTWLQDGMEGGVPISNSCSATPGYLCICDPGGTAYHDEDAESTDDAYIAEYDPVQGTLSWSTYVGGNTWEYPGVYLMQLNSFSDEGPFFFRKVADLRVDASGNVWAMTTTVNPHGDWQETPVPPAPPFYHKELDWTAGKFQSEVTLHLFRPDHSLFYGTQFGAWFLHSESSAFNLLPFGCDIGKDLALVEGEAIYWTGTTGNDRFPTQCPYPGTSYCEPFVESNNRYMQAFATRMSLQDINIGINDPLNLGPASLAVYPNPTSAELHLFHQGLPLTAGLLSIIDATGRVVRGEPLAGSVVSVHGLANGIYHVQVQNRTGRILGSASFVITR